MNSGRQNSVKHLASLYTVVVGIALASGIYNLIDPRGHVLPFNKETFFTFVAFLVTLFPFYHGALRHLDKTYIEEPVEKIQDGALMADFLILFIEGCFFLALSGLIKTPILFAWGIVMLLGVDVLWSFIVHLIFKKNLNENNMKPESKWAIINMVTIVFLLLYLVLMNIYPSTKDVNLLQVSSVFLIILSFRTIIDYCWTWKIYFPSESSR